jgi:hypothetical protein
VQFEDFVYPPYGTPLVDAYNGRFEAAFVVLHPFIGVPESLSWRSIGKYPDDAEILACGTRHRWTAVASETGLGFCARVNQALLTSIGSLKGDLADRSGRDALRSFLVSRPIWMPTEGRFEPILQPSFLQVFTAAGFQELIYVPELANFHPAVRLPLEGLQDGSIPFPGCGTLIAPDLSFVITVDWDSFFTIFYSSRDFLTESARRLDLEGFFASSNTDHAWFNYSMGCATVTVSPEDWQQTV